MKTTKQIIWETKKEMFNRLWSASVGKEDDWIKVATLLLRELNIVRDELEAERVERVSLRSTKKGRL